MINQPTVTLLAHTQVANLSSRASEVESWIEKHPSFRELAREKENYIVGEKFAELVNTSTGGTESEMLIEFAGRACYQSFHRPNPATKAIPDYIRHIIGQGHESVLEHSSASFYIEGVSRNLTHELIRHRHLSFSQLSQRFVDESDSEFVLPPALGAVDPGELNALQHTVDETHEDYYGLVTYLQNEKGLPRKQAREAARSILPGNTETKMVVTGNFRAWRDVLKKRLDPAADAEIRRLCESILVSLLVVAPSVFEDLYIQYYE